jgi:LPXTG-motif cell wall-anchored protein
MRDGEVDTARRDVLKRAAVLGGSVVWATPVVQSLSGTAWAATSGSVETEGTTPGSKGGDASPPESLGGKLAKTGSDNAVEVVATGAGLVAAGAAAIAVSRRRRQPSLAEDAPPHRPRHRRSKDG